MCLVRCSVHDWRQGSALSLRWADHTGYIQQVSNYTLPASTDSSAGTAGSHSAPLYHPSELRQLAGFVGGPYLSETTESTLHATAEDGSQPPRSPNKVPRATFPPGWVSHTAFLGAGTRRQIADIQRSVRAGEQCSAVQCSAVQCSTRDLNAPGNSQ